VRYAASPSFAAADAFLISCLHEARDGGTAAHRHLYYGLGSSSQLSRRATFSLLPCISTMIAKFQRPKGQDGVLSSLNMAIDVLNLAKEVSSITQTKAVFGSVSILLTMIKVRFPLFCDETLQVHTQLGFGGQRTGLRRARVILRRYLQSPRPGNEWKETE